MLFFQSPVCCPSQVTTSLVRWTVTLLGLAPILVPTKATVYEYYRRDGVQSTHPYPSLAANFGMPWEVGHSYQAEVRYLADNPTLCHETPISDDTVVTKNDYDNDAMDRHSIHYHSSTNQQSTVMRGHNHRALALLAEEGGCSIEEKVRVAEATSPSVGFLIVYSNVPDPVVLEPGCETTSNTVYSYYKADAECLSDTLVRVTSVTLFTGRALIRYADYDTQLNGSLVFLDSVPPKGFQQGRQKQFEDPDAFPEPGTTDLYSIYMDDAMFRFDDCDEEDHVTTFVVHKRSWNNPGLIFLIFIGCGIVVMFFTVVHRRRMDLDEQRERRLRRGQRRRLRRLRRLRQRAAAEAARRRLLTKEEARHFTVSGDVAFAYLPHGAAGDCELGLSNCAICIESLRDTSDSGTVKKVTRLPCIHSFHTECILPWLTERQGTCPLCKFDVVDFLRGSRDNNVVERLSDDDDDDDGPRVPHNLLLPDPRALMPSPWLPVYQTDQEDDGEEEDEEYSVGTESSAPELEMVETPPPTESSL